MNDKPPYRDPELRGVYVRRCKCGKRLQFDRIDPYAHWMGCWITCICGRTAKSGDSKESASENWNNNYIIDS